MENTRYEWEQSWATGEKTKAEFFHYFPVESPRSVKTILQVDNETMQMEYQIQQHVLLSPQLHENEKAKKNQVRAEKVH